MRWLHLSDIHYNPEEDGRSTKQLRDKLPKYIRENNIIVDNVFITGDYRHAGKDSRNEEVIAKEAVIFIKKIAESAGVNDPANIHIVPGNHDLKRVKGKRELERIDKIKSNYEPHHGKFDKDDLNFLLKRFSFFQYVSRLLHPENPIWPDDLLPLHTYRIYKNYSLLYMNTALCSNDNKDRGKLIIGNEILYDALDSINNENPKTPIIILAHHGIQIFNDAEQKVIERLFEDYPVKLYLCGDAHTPWRKKTNDVQEITMGCIKYEKGMRTVFSVGEINGQDYSIEAHEWDTGETEWGLYTQFNKALSKWTICVPTPSVKPAKVVTISRPTQPSRFFDGRDTLIEVIENKIAKDAKLVLINGIGGIGKTEICRNLFHKYAQNSLTNVERIGWVIFSENLSLTFWGQFTEVEANNAKDYLEMAKGYLNQQGSNLLLFIDNANNISEQDAAVLSTLGCKIILTSRKKLDRIEPIEVGKLSLEKCRKIYRRHSEDHYSSDEKVDAIIELADRHTLSVELLAKTQHESGKSAQELLITLQEKGFSLTGINEEITYLHNPEQPDSKRVEDIFIEHMAKIFDIANIENGSEELRVIQLFSLLAAVSVPYKVLSKWLELPNGNAVNVLVRKGWLSREAHGEISISMHPVISSVIRYKSMPAKENTGTLVINLAHELHFKSEDIFTSKLPFLSHAVSVANLFNNDGEDYGRLLHNIAFIYSSQGDYPRALEWYQKAIAINEKVLGKEHPDTAAIYNNIAAVYERQGDYPGALECFQKALAISEKVLGKEHPDTATTYNNIAAVYERQGDYPRALEWCQKAIAINEKVLGEEHPDTATTYNNIAGVYSSQGDYPEALEWYRKALAINEKVLGKEHPETATTYNNIAFIYSSQGNYPEALEWCQKALAINEKVLGEEHPDTATTYNNIAGVYSSQGDYPRALEWFQKALIILELRLGNQHPNTIVVIDNMKLIKDKT